MTRLPMVNGVPVMPVLGAFVRGAHHPHCDRHAHHVIWIRERPLCLGCTCMAAGLLIGCPAGLWIGTACSNWSAWFFLHVLLVIPTAIQPWFQKRLFKMISRTLLGVSTASYLVGLAYSAPLPEPRFWVGAGLTIVFLLSARVLVWLRSFRPDDPCVACPLGTYPVCEWNMPRWKELSGIPISFESTEGAADGRN
jgi:hypothetical protein